MADPSDNPTGNASTAGNAGAIDGKVPTPVGMPDFSSGLPHSTD